MFADPETWVAIAFVVLMGVFAWLGVHRKIFTALDHRAERIKAELDDARRLKDEAAKLLAEYQARHASAEREAQDIIAAAKAEAERKTLENRLATKLADAEKTIAATRTTAMGNVRGIAADAAAAIVQRLTGLAPDTKTVNKAVDASLKG